MAAFAAETRGNLHNTEATCAILGSKKTFFSGTYGILEIWSRLDKLEYLYLHGKITKSFLLPMESWSWEILKQTSDQEDGTLGAWDKSITAQIHGWDWILLDGGWAKNA